MNKITIFHHRMYGMPIKSAIDERLLFIYKFKFATEINKGLKTTLNYKS